MFEIPGRHPPTLRRRETAEENAEQYLVSDDVSLSGLNFGNGVWYHQFTTAGSPGLKRGGDIYRR